MTVVQAAVLYVGIVFACGFALGTLRVLAVAPAIGETAAVLLELPLMLAASWYACRRAIAMRPVAHRPAPRLAMGALAFGLLLAAELALAVLGFGRTVAQHIATYQSLSAQVGLAAQVGFASFPLIQCRR